MAFLVLFVYSVVWLGSRVVSVLDSGEEGPVFKSVATISGNSLRQTVHTNRASVHQEQQNW